MKRKLDDEMVKRLKYIFVRKMDNARHNGVAFSLKFEDMYWPEYCPVLGLELNYNRKGRKEENSPSFDRIDPSLSYTPENTRIISERANRIKNDGTAEEHRKIAAYMEGGLYL